MAELQEMAVRKADVSDAPKLLPLVERYHAFERIEANPETRGKALAQLLVDEDLGSIWLATSEDRLIGYMAVCYGFSIEFGGREAFIDEFYLAEAERGKGFGRRIAQHVIAWLREQDFVAFHLEVDTTNDQAQRLYKDLGFKLREKYQLLSLNLTHPGSADEC
jgi:ribosomal protein S18 acetylase RimI-like enzyme